MFLFRFNAYFEWLWAPGLDRVATNSQANNHVCNIKDWEEIEAENNKIIICKTMYGGVMDKWIWAIYTKKELGDKR